MGLNILVLGVSGPCIHVIYALLIETNVIDETTRTLQLGHEAQTHKGIESAQYCYEVSTTRPISSAG